MATAAKKPGGLEFLKAEYERLKDAYEAQSKYWKWKSWIVGAYVVLAGFSLVKALPAPNTLGASVGVAAITVGLERQYSALVRNESGRDWSNVTVTFKGDVDQVATFERPRVPAKGNFQTPGITFIPVSVTVDASQGSYTLVVPRAE